MKCEEIMANCEGISDLGPDLGLGLDSLMDDPDDQDRAAKEQAEIDAALAELQAELDRLDKRTFELSITFTELKEQRDALNERVIAKLRKGRRGQRKASRDAMRDISLAYKAKQAQQAQMQRAAPRKRYIPAKPRAQSRPAPQQAMQQRQLKPIPPQQVIKVITQPAAPAAAPQTTPPKTNLDVKNELQRILANAGIDLAANKIAPTQAIKPIPATEPTKPASSVDARRLTP